VLVGFAVNHMTVPSRSYKGLLKIAAALGCTGIEVRNDLASALFDGADPARAGEEASAMGLRILSVAELLAFNDWSDAKADDARSLIRIAVSCQAEAISLIPCNDHQGRTDLRRALAELEPLLAAAGLIGLVEPLGFESSSLRYKSEVVEAIEAIGASDHFRLVHDTFHHALAGGGPVFAEHTGIVHVSAVSDPALALSEMGDRHRVLIDHDDRLGNTEQINSLLAAGYAGPISFEVFSPAFHAVPNPETQISKSIEFISSSLVEMAA